jgi:hypothetical protein
MSIGNDAILGPLPIDDRLELILGNSASLSRMSLCTSVRLVATAASWVAQRRAGWVCNTGLRREHGLRRERMAALSGKCER